MGSAPVLHHPGEIPPGLQTLPRFWKFFLLKALPRDGSLIPKCSSYLNLFFLQAPQALVSNAFAPYEFSLPATKPSPIPPINKFRVGAFILFGKRISMW